MKGNTIVAWMWCLTATWFWFESTTTTSAWSLTSEDNYNSTSSYLKKYPSLSFNSYQAGPKGYGNFLERLRNLIANPDDNRHGVRVLRQTVPIEERFVLIQLTSQELHSVTLAMNVTNSYIVGFRSGTYFFYFPPENQIQEEQISHLFPDIRGNYRQPLTNLGVSYVTLQRAAGRSRNQIALGRGPLGRAINHLYYRVPFRSDTTSDATLAESLIVIIQMIAEAARFRSIESAMRVRYQTNNEDPPHENMIGIENEWGGISRMAQEHSSYAGLLNVGVNVVNEAGAFQSVSSLSELSAFVALMLFRCNLPPSPQFPLCMLIRNVVPNFVGDDDVCPDAEPTMRITGLNGLCLDVYGGIYEDGNKIILWPCKSKYEGNQLWTFKKDETIRSNGATCLTASGYSDGSLVTINDCNCVPRDSIRWTIADDGTIRHKYSGLVLTGTGGTPSQGEHLARVKNEDFGTRQSWRPSNNTQPFVGHIVGFNGYCLVPISEDEIWLDTCVYNKTDQKWARYGDGSIRPNQKTTRCLTAGDQNSVVKILPCDPGSNLQRWVYQTDKTFRNLYFGLVLTIQNKRELQDIIMMPVNGEDNQKWFPML